MKLFTFKRGGVHPPDEKHSSADKAIVTIDPKAGCEMVYPMSQHIGAPCTPIVEKGEKVLKGQKIAESEALVSAPVHSSVSGIVKEFRKVVLPTGIFSQAIVIENDGNDEEHPSLNKVHDYRNMSREEICEIIKEAGIVGMGGAGFPTHVKITPPRTKYLDTIIMNGAECEPYLTNDHRVMVEQPDRIVEGIRVIMSLYDNAQGIIGIENNKPDAIAAINNYIKDIPNVKVVPLIPKYPQGAEKQLIYATTGREVPSGKLPADVGCIVLNVETCLAIERAVLRGRPLMNRKITLSGDMVKNPGNYKVQIGTSYSDFIEATGGLTSRPYKMISGGPMMGVAMYTLDVPVIKTSSSILLLSEKQAKLPPERGCIRCGKCVEHCPMGLLPLDLNQNVIHNEMDLFEKNNGLDCIECGSCSYVCPAKRHLAQSIRASRRSLMAAKAAAAKK